MSNTAQDKTENLGIIMSFMHTYDVLNRYLEIELAKLGTSPIRFATMNAIIIHGGSMTPTAISRWLFRSPRTVTSMLDSLEKDGFIERQVNRKDRRSIIIKVTKKGWEATNKIVPITEQISQKALSGLDDDQVETLQFVQEKFRKHLLSQIDTGKRG